MRYGLWREKPSLNGLKYVYDRNSKDTSVATEWREEQIVATVPVGEDRQLIKGHTSFGGFQGYILEFLLHGANRKECQSIY